MAAFRRSSLSSSGLSITLCITHTWLTPDSIIVGLVDFASSQLLNTQAHSDMEEACTACIIALPLLLPFKLRNSEQGRAGQGRAGQDV